METHCLSPFKEIQCQCIPEIKLSDCKSCQEWAFIVLHLSVFRI